MWPQSLGMHELKLSNAEGKGDSKNQRSEFSTAY